MLEAVPRLAVLSAMAATLAACGSESQTSALPPAIAQTDRAASGGALLYVTDAQTHSVVVLTYPGGKPVGILSGFTNPQGECVDAAGDVWIVDIAASTITEYAHGGTTPIATLQDAGQFPTACAVNPKTGDLAVANVATATLEPGSISIYANARGTPANYAGANLSMADSIAYDDRGNLFVAGTQFAEQFYYGELRSGGKALHQLHWPKAVAGAGIAWDGRRIAVTNASIDLGIPVYRLAGNRLSGISYLAGPCNLFQFLIDRNRLVCSDESGKTIRIYAYPNGGQSVATIVDSRIRPIASVVSRT
jgi:hypothetical protein